MKILNPTIIIIAYNRPVALSRILGSIAVADFSTYTDVRLIISIDGGGSNFQMVKEVAESFYWQYGVKEVIVHNVNIGLRKHVISCGDLTEKYENIIMLEEDCFVSKNFYNFSIQSLDFYASDKRIAGISLYAYSYYESIGTLFIPIADGYDTYFLQVPSSLGQIWTRAQWQGFKKYYNTKPIIAENDKIPEKVKTWPDSSWKKYFYKYMVDNDLYFVYPQIAFSTNFGDTGENLTEQTQVYQVILENYEKGKEYCFPLFEESNNKYDAYFEFLPKCLISRGVNIDLDTCVDVMGSKPLLLFENKYVISSKTCTQSIIGFDNVLIPVVQNILYKLKGDAIHYGLREHFGILEESSKFQQIANIQTLGFTTGMLQVMSGKYYKIGYYFLKPLKILDMLKRKLKK